MKLTVTDDAPLNLAYPYTNRLAPGDVFEVDDEKGEALLDTHGYLERAPDDAEVTDGESVSPTTVAEGDVDDEVAEHDALDDFTDLEGVGPARAKDIRAAGYETFEDLRAAAIEDLVAIDGVSEDAATAWQEQLAEDRDEE